MLVNGNQIYSDKIGLHKAYPSFFFSQKVVLKYFIIV